MDVNISVIARMHSDFATKFGIPRQSGLVEELRSTIDSSIFSMIEGIARVNTR